MAAIRFNIKEGFVVVIGFYKDIPWCSIITHEDRQGKILHDLNNLKIFPRPSRRYTDRAKKMLSTTRAVAAAMRVTRFTDPSTLRFGLHVRLLESMTH